MSFRNFATANNGVLEAHGSSWSSADRLEEVLKSTRKMEKLRAENKKLEAKAARYHKLLDSRTEELDESQRALVASQEALVSLQAKFIKLQEKGSAATIEPSYQKSVLRKLESLHEIMDEVISTDLSRVKEQVEKCWDGDSWSDATWIAEEYVELLRMVKKHNYLANIDEVTEYVKKH
jgi:exonuclease VII large subunit